MTIPVLLSGPFNAAHLERCLFSLAHRRSQTPFEIVMADADKRSHWQLSRYSSCFPWTFLLTEGSATPGRLANLALEHSAGEAAVLLNEHAILWEGCMDSLVTGRPNHHYGVAWPKSHRIASPQMETLDPYGSNLWGGFVNFLTSRPASPGSRCAVAISRWLWKHLGGCDDGYADKLGCWADFVGRLGTVVSHSDLAVDRGIALYQTWQEDQPRYSIEQPWPSSGPKAKVLEVRSNIREEKSK